jgi:branched-chain amino acid transport system ATP-binding protein
MVELLAIENLSAGYGKAEILSSVSFTLAPGQSLALLGRNGTGKTTLIRSIMGLTTRHAGRIILDGRDITALRPDQRASAGLGWVPQERNIFRSLTVDENLTAVARPGPWDLASVYGLFPRLRQRRRHFGTELSGGEQQMLAIARALVLNPRLVLLDEPTEGLAPRMVAELLVVLRDLVRDQGLSLIIVEQKALQILDLTDRAMILDRGRIVYEAKSRDLRAEPKRLETFLGALSAPVRA